MLLKKHTRTANIGKEFLIKQTIIVKILSLKYLIFNKTRLLKDQKNKPFGEILSVNEKEILRIHKTSGTSTSPLMIYLTKKDIESVVEIGAKVLSKQV